MNHALTTLAALPAASSAVPCAGLEPGVPRRAALSPAAAAASLSLHRDTVIRAIKAGHLYAIKAGRQWRIPHYALAGWLERGGQAGNAASLAECKRRQS